MSRYWYHGTTTDKLPTILRLGLLPGNLCKRLGVSAKNYPWCDDGIYLESDVDEAAKWSTGWTGRGHPVLLRFKDSIVRKNCHVIGDPSFGSVLGGGVQLTTMVAKGCVLRPDALAVVELEEDGPYNLRVARPIQWESATAEVAERFADLEGESDLERAAKSRAPRRREVRVHSYRRRR